MPDPIPERIDVCSEPRVAWIVMHPWPKLTPDRRLCSSPRRNQCRAGAAQEDDLGIVWNAAQFYCQELPW